MVALKLPSLLTVIATMGVLACGGQSDGGAMKEQDPMEPIANEAIVQLSSTEIAELRRRADSGDVQAMDELANYYLVNYGDWNEDTIYWQLQLARNGSCEHWQSLMFIEMDGFPIPNKFLKEGETLKAIGEQAGCPPYNAKKLR